MALYGYSRVSTIDQDLRLQRAALKAAGCDGKGQLQPPGRAHRVGGAARLALSEPEDEDVPDHLLAPLSPLGWEHVNLTGDYVWVAGQSASETDDGFKRLRTPPTPFAKAA
jgi:hypothetical protein